MKKYIFGLVAVLFLAILIIPNVSSAQLGVSTNGCYGWNKYSVTTGQLCSYDDSSLPLGCTSTVGYSPVTGLKCDSTSTTPTTPSITVLSPNGGETWSFGNIYEITWKAKNARPTVGIGLTRPDSSGDGYNVCNLGSASSSDGKYSFKLIENMVCPYDIENLKSGQYYKAIVYEQGMAGLLVQSDNYFTITSSTVSTNDPIISGVSGPQTLKVGEQGVWKVKASSPNGGRLSYSVDWGDSVVVCQTVPNGTCSTTAQAPQQSATFTHKYSTAGTYKPTFTVTSPNTIVCITTPCPGNGGSAKTSLSVKVGNTTTPSITVLSPNGGETWAKDSYKTISWKTDGSFKKFKIEILTYPEVVKSDGGIETGAWHIGYSTTNSFSWKVGSVDCGGCTPPADGSYKILVRGQLANDYKIYGVDSSNILDVSNAPFTIISSTKNSNPVLGLFAVPVSVNVGQSVNFNFSATDTDNDDLCWSVDWGDSQGGGMACSTSNLQQKEGWTYNPNHTWDKAGTYTVGVVVWDPEGGVASTSFNVKVIRTTSPTISGVSGPQTLNVNQTGTWKVKATNPGRGTLSYSVDWGDNIILTCSSGDAPCVAQSTLSPQQSATFTHSYSQAGTYTPIFYVTNTSGQGAKTSFSVKVSSINCPEILVNCVVGTTPESYVGKDGCTTFRCVPVLAPLDDDPGGNDDGSSTRGGIVSFVPESSLTANVLSALDDKKDLQINSVTNTSASCKEFTMILAKGMSNSEVKCLQKLLIEKGFKINGINAGEERNFFGYDTMMTVRKFQTANGLKADGVFGPITRGALVK